MTTCVCKYNKTNIDGLKGISTKLLNLINTNLLVTTTTDSCVLPFNCCLWADIKDLLAKSDCSGTPDTTGIITDLIGHIANILKDTTCLNHGYASQLERYKCILEALRARLGSVCCNNSDNCPEAFGDLLCILIQILTRLLSSVLKIESLSYYQCCTCKVSDSTTCNCPMDCRLYSTFFECLLCDLINDICDLEMLTNELNAVIMAFVNCETKYCTPCYTMPSTPKKVRPVCTTNTGNYYNKPINYYGYNQGSSSGCSCGSK